MKSVSTQWHSEALEGTCKRPVGTRRWLLPPQCFRFAYLWGAGAVVSTRKAIRGNQRQSELIRCNQTQSEALSVREMD